MMMDMTSFQPNYVPEQSRSLFLGDLPTHCQDMDIYQAFQRFGQIEGLRIMRGKDGRCLGYGFITYASTTATNSALEMNGALFMGRPIKVGCAFRRTVNPNAFKKVKNIPDTPIHSAQVHFSFISKQNRYLITEDTIRALFSQFGEVKEVSMKKSSVDKSRGEQTGYGFIHFPLTDEGVNAAVKASTTVSQIIVDNVLYDCCLTHCLEAFLEKQNKQIPPRSPFMPDSGFSPASSSPFDMGMNPFGSAMPSPHFETNQMRSPFPPQFQGLEQSMQSSYFAPSYLPPPRQQFEFPRPPLSHGFGGMPSLSAAPGAPIPSSLLEQYPSVFYANQQQQQQSTPFVPMTSSSSSASPSSFSNPRTW